MIEITNVSKRFEGVEALKNLTLRIPEGEVFGLVGTNGAGKSTLLRLLCGVLRQDEGDILIDGKRVWENEEIKQELAFMPDDAYFFPNATASGMADFYAAARARFDRPRFADLIRRFGLAGDRPIRTYSKGMRKQLSVILGLCTGAKYLFCDETFDGLDPVMRQAVKSIFAGDMVERGLTPVIASHNLRELEDICDHVGLLHAGGLLLSRDLASMKLGLQKVQCVFSDEADAENALSGLELLSHDIRGRLHTLTIRAAREEILSRFEKLDMIFFELLPLTLEEIFISETEVIGYDIKNFILN